VVSLQNVNDVTVVERREVRVIVSIPATLVLVGRRNARSERRVFDCRAVNMSASRIGVACIAEVEVGEHAILRLEQFGEFRGAVQRLLKGGFVLGIELSDAQREALEVKIEGFEKIKNHDAPDRRRNVRFIPKDARSRLVWADGSTEGCVILDLSVCGAAVLVDTVPEIGTVVALGCVIGRVVRHIRDGFAMQFIETQSSDTVESLATAQ
jgi:hypothetical protein